MTEAEKGVLTQKGLIGQENLRLSCQILCDHDMTVRAISRLSNSGRASAGNRPEPQITPAAVWTVRG
jgi:hypothetical protein